MTTHNSQPSINCQHPGCGARLVMVRNNVAVCPNEPTLYAHGRSIHFDAATFKLMSRELDRREAFARLPLLQLDDKAKKGRMGVKLYAILDTTDYYELFAAADKKEMLAAPQDRKPPLTSDCLLGRLSPTDFKCYWFLKPPTDPPWLIEHEQVALVHLFVQGESPVGSVGNRIWGSYDKTTKAWAANTLKLLKKLKYAEPVKSAGDSKPTGLWKITETGKHIIKQMEEAK